MPAARILTEDQRRRLTAVVRDILAELPSHHPGQPKGMGKVRWLFGQLDAEWGQAFVTAHRQVVTERRPSPPGSPAAP